MDRTQRDHGVKAWILAGPNCPPHWFERTRACLADLLAGIHGGSEPAAPLTAGAWLIPAGGWNVSWKHTSSLLAQLRDTSPEPLVLVGAQLDDRGHPTAGWAEVLRRTGGDLSGLTEWPALPVASAWVSPPAARAHFSAGPDLDARIRSALQARWRVIRHPALDGWWDPRVRVLEVITSLQRGGAERVVLNLHDALHDSPLVTTRLCVLGSPTREAFSAPAGTIQLRAGYDAPARAQALLEVLRASGGDLLHGHLLDGEIVNRLTAAGAPVLLHLHNARPGWPASHESLASHGRLMLCACARAIESAARAAHPSVPARTVWNGVQLQPAPDRPKTEISWRERLSLRSEEWLLVSVANPRPQKRLDRLPAILAALLQRGRSARLVLAGESARSQAAGDAELTRLMAAAESAGVADRITIAGSLADSQLTDLLAEADVLISPSAYEGLSLAHLEALRAGTPVVATRVGGTAEIGDRGTGLWLVDAEADDDAFANAITEAVRAPSPAALPADFTAKAMAERSQWLFRVAVAWSLRQQSTKRGLLLVTNNFSPGGAQSSAARLLSALRDARHPVRAVVLQENESQPSPGLQRLRARGVPVLILPSADHTRADLALHALLDELSHSPPALVLFWNVIPEYKMRLADALPDIPIWDVSPGEMLHASLERWFAARPPGWPVRDARAYGELLAGMVVKNSTEAGLARQTYGTEVRWIPNGVPVPVACPAPRPHGDGLIIGTAARLHPHKRLEDLIAAIRLLVAAGHRVELHVAGDADGPDGRGYADGLRAGTRDLPVRWCGHTEEITAFLATIDIVAVIAEPAGCPNFILESMAAAKPIIATRVGGAADLIVDGVSGLLVPPRDPQTLADGLSRLMADADLRLAIGQAAWKRTGEQFSLERMMTSYLSLLPAELPAHHG